MKSEKERIEIYKQAISESWEVEEKVRRYREKLFAEHRKKYLDVLENDPESTKWETNEILNDLYELLNNLNDDLKLDFKEGEQGYKSFEGSYQAVKRYTLKTLKSKIFKWKHPKSFLEDTKSELKIQCINCGNIGDTVDVKSKFCKDCYVQDTQHAPGDKE